MAEKSPLVFVDGGFSQLPPGDSIDGVALGSLVAGSGLVGGGDLNTGNKRLDIGLTASPSGLIFVGDALGLDGSDQATADAALASGNAGLELGAVALASGLAAQSEANTALATGNAALEAAVNFQGGSSLTFTAASAVASGYAVGLDDGGKVQSIRVISSDNTDPVSFGSSVVFASTNEIIGQIDTAYDATNQRVVVVYRGNTTTRYGQSIVGTVSGSSISFGTPVVFNSGITNYITCSFDSSSSKILIAYQDESDTDNGNAIVGTVSGTSISFGSEATFSTGNVDYLTSSFDSVNNKFAVSYRDASASNYGRTVIGTVSGTSISFGSPVNFTSYLSYYFASTFDATSGKLIVAYTRDTPQTIECVAGTISGTSITFGSAVIAGTGSNCRYATVAHDSVLNKLILTYFIDSVGYTRTGSLSGTTITLDSASTLSFIPQSTDSLFDTLSNRYVLVYQGTSNYGTIVIGTNNGSSLSYTTPTVYKSSGSYPNVVCLDTSNKVPVISYILAGTSSGESIVVSGQLFSENYYPTISSQNNFIGIAQATVASGTDVSVLLPRAVDFNQTGLNPGYFYYVDPTTSGFTAASGQPAAWSGAYNWAPVAKAVSSSGLLLLNPM
jgi:hypothetical protein